MIDLKQHVFERVAALWSGASACASSAAPAGGGTPRAFAVWKHASARSPNSRSFAIADWRFTGVTQQILLP